MSAATRLASSSSVMPPSEPGTHGMPRRFAVRFASILSPMVRMCSAFGPMKQILWCASTSAKRAFSDRKP
jgi:hypothetical protein